VNLTSAIRSSYLELVPRICPGGDDAQYGSSTEHDVYALQAISRRIHYGAFYVAEAKFRSDPATYRRLVSARDREALAAALTRHDVERRVIERVQQKVRHIQARADTRVRIALSPEVVGEFYRGAVIPLTKEGEVRYLLERGDQSEGSNGR
jgi:chorismate mutase